jgi:hypothetical protein
MNAIILPAHSIAAAKVRLQSFQIHEPYGKASPEIRFLKSLFRQALGAGLPERLA